MELGDITRDEAFKLSPKYVEFIENPSSGFMDIVDGCYKLKKGQKCLTYSRPENRWIIGKISSVCYDWRSEDGPVMRFTDGKYSWRIDGSECAVAV